MFLPPTPNLSVSPEPRKRISKSRPTSPAVMIPSVDYSSIELYNQTVEKYGENLKKWEFDEFLCTEDELVYLALYMFIERGCLEVFQISRQILVNFLVKVKSSYRNNLYHNWRHAFDVIILSITARKKNTSIRLSDKYKEYEPFHLMIFKLKPDRLSGDSCLLCDDHYIWCFITVDSRGYLFSFGGSLVSRYRSSRTE